MLFILNRNGMFGLYSLRSVERYRRFAAAGSGSSYALGAVQSVRCRMCSALQRAGLRACFSRLDQRLAPPAGWSECAPTAQGV